MEGVVAFLLVGLAATVCICHYVISERDEAQLQNIVLRRQVESLKQTIRAYQSAR